MCILLKMVKYPKKTQTLNIVDLISSETNNSINKEEDIVVNSAKPGYRKDNSWHQFDPDFLGDMFETTGSKAEQDLAKWERTNFLDKSYWGYYCWPATITVNSNKRSTFEESNGEPNVYAHVIGPIEDKFKNDSEFVKKFIKLSTIEESKGNEKFEKKRFYLFKALFRNFGCTEIINGLFEHLKTLVSDRDRETHECNHKLAAEIISGLIRGSKYWSLNKLKPMWAQLKNLFELVMENITTENIKLWLNCFSTSFVSDCPGRNFFV